MRAALLLFGVLTLVPRSVWPQGNPLGPEFRVNTYTTDGQGQPSVATDSSGNFVVVWHSDVSGVFANVYGQRFASSGDPLGPEFRVNTSTDKIHSFPSIAADAAGNFVVIWQHGFLTGTILSGQRYASSGVPLGTEFSLGTSGYYPLAPAAAADPAGNFVVVWDALLQDGSDRAIAGQRYASSGVPLGSEFRINTHTTGAQTSSSVAVDGSGNFVVVWTSNTQDGSDLGIFGQRFASSGAPLGSEFRVNTYTTNGQGFPSVAADSSGNFVVVWQSAGQDGSGAGVFGQRYASSGAPLGPEFRVNTFTTSYQRSPSVAADASGNFVVAWHGLGSGYDVFGQRYDSSGAALGGEFPVNTFTPNNQAQVALAADPSGDFVVVWQSSPQDGSGYGVFGQRYRPILPVELMQLRVE